MTEFGALVIHPSEKWASFALLVYSCTWYFIAAGFSTLLEEGLGFNSLCKEALLRMIRWMSQRKLPL